MDSVHLPVVVIGLLGTTLDMGKHPDRWQNWRPTVSICQQPDLIVSRFELLHGKETSLAEQVRRDINSVSPETKVVLHPIEFGDPWDFEQVYEALFNFARSYPFDAEAEDYLIHITTGTHVAQICLFSADRIAPSARTPAAILARPPARRPRRDEDHRPRSVEIRQHRPALSPGAGCWSQLSERRHRDPQPRLQSLIDRIERVAIATRDPLLLMGATGAGKSRLARRIFELKKARHAVKGNFVDVNCATLRGEGAMSALFGHVKGAFTGAVQERAGLLRAANNGVLFLDEIGELGLDEQAMLLRALEEKTFLPLGSDREAHSDFQFICGTNRDLLSAVDEGRFREDLLARINLWTFTLPGLRDRHEDIEPNLQYELDQYAERTGTRVTFNREARSRFLDFALSPAATWKGNFRDLNAAVARMSTLCSGGRISVEIVEEEIARLNAGWRTERRSGASQALTRLLSKEQNAKLDLFDRLQLEKVVEICQRSRTHIRGWPATLRSLADPKGYAQRCRPPTQVPRSIWPRLGSSLC